MSKSKESMLARWSSEAEVGEGDGPLAVIVVGWRLKRTRVGVRESGSPGWTMMPSAESASSESGSGESRPVASSLEVLRFAAEGDGESDEPWRRRLEEAAAGGAAPLDVALAIIAGCTQGILRALASQFVTQSVEVVVVVVFLDVGLGVVVCGREKRRNQWW